MGVIRVLDARLTNVLSLPYMLPSEFCDQYVTLPKEERGYRKACIEALATACNLPAETVKNWWDKDNRNFDKCPDYAKELLKKESALRQMEQIIRVYREGM